MATYIRDDSINNLQSALQFYAQQSAQRQARDLQRAELRRSMGDNIGAEAALRSSEQGLAGKIYDSITGNKAREWEIDNPYRGKELGLRTLIDTPEKQQVQTLKDINAVKQLKNIYGKDTDSLNKQLGLMGLTQTPQDIISGYDNKVAQNKEIEGYNLKAEAYNKKIADLPNSYKGNESYQNQQILDNAMNAISNAGTMHEKLENYNRYLTTGKAIADHYGHRFEAQPASFFGIGSGGKGGTGSGKLEDVYIKDIEGNAIIPLKLTNAEINDPEIKEKLFNKYKKQLASKGINSWEDLDVGYASGNSFNLSTDDKLKNKINKQLEKEKLQNALTMLNQSTGWDVGDANKGTVIYNKDEAKAYISGLGLEAYQDKDGKWRVKGNRNVAKAQPQSDVDQFLGD